MIGETGGRHESDDCRTTRTRSVGIAAAKERKRQQEICRQTKKQRLKEECGRQAESELKTWKDKLLEAADKEDEQEKEKISGETKEYLLRFENQKEILVMKLVREITGCTDTGGLL